LTRALLILFAIQAAVRWSAERGRGGCVMLPTLG
jgi:hypothetical protein